ncbi:hypothetical protein, partial [Winkia neuii]
KEVQSPHTKKSKKQKHTIENKNNPTTPNNQPKQPATWGHTKKPNPKQEPDLSATENYSKLFLPSLSTLFPVRQASEALFGFPISRRFRRATGNNINRFPQPITNQRQVSMRTPAAELGV